MVISSINDYSFYIYEIAVLCSRLSRSESLQTVSDGLTACLFKHQLVKSRLTPWVGETVLSKPASFSGCLHRIDSDNYNNGIIAICQHTFCLSISQNNQSHTHIPNLHNTHRALFCNYK